MADVKQPHNATTRATSPCPSPCPSPSSAPWRELLAGALAPLLATRLALAVVGLVAVKQLPALGGSQLTPSAWLNIWFHWDSAWYLNIARDGYQYTPGEESNLAFFPLFPFLMRWLGNCLGNSDWSLALGGLLVSNLALVAAVWGFWALARLEGDRAMADRSVWLLLVFPSSLFLSAVYGMSLSLAVCVWAYYHARRGAWAAAGVVAALNGLARPDGFVLAIALAAEYLEQRQWRLTAVRWNIVWLALNPAATGCWLAAQWVLYGTPLAFVHAQQGWDDSPMLADLLSLGGMQRFCVTVLVTGLTLVAAVRLRTSYGVYGLLQLLIWVGSSRTVAMPRYALLLFPAFMALALVTERRAWLLHAVMTFAMALAALNMVRFALGYFIA